MTDNLYCPYCEHDCGDHFDDCHNSDVEYELECPECEKSFIYTITYYPSFTAHKADCLNGEKHKYEPICGIPKEVFKDKFRCVDCGKKTTISKEVRDEEETQ